ncbi:nucleolar transcription factor 1 [Rhinoderma darwinii]|uniref:nucleolar transcription factor 1 n=1 Tax=Rhinoderma darwinii TaxID=43563 RepID=UPI003F66C6C3
MNGAAGNEETNTMTAPSDQDNWPQEDMVILLESMKTNMPALDHLKYKTTESHLDWNKLAFKTYTGDMCHQKWLEIATVVRKFRTLTELLQDAEELVRHPYKGKKLKTHPQFPKKPLTPYFRFFMEKRAKYAKLHPEMSNLDLTKILSKKYKELTDKKKSKYLQDFQNEREDFKKNMAKFREEYPDLMPASKKSDIPEKPKTPQQLWYNHEKKIYLKLKPDAATKEVKDSLGKQWSQLSDKKRLKWIHKALEYRKQYEDTMRDYIQKHPEISEEGAIKSTLTKAERQLKDKFDGRPTKPPPNSYSMYCAELMANMKDVPSTERMVLCSQQWKLLSPKEKDAYQKKCDQRKKDYEVNLIRFLESLPEEEQQRVLTEEKMVGVHKKGTQASKARSRPTLAERKKAAEERGKLPETPKTAEEIWQQSVIGDYLARFKNDRAKALKGMESTWLSMEKKEKIMWIKKAAEDQKRYERELSDMRSAPATAGPVKKMKFLGEPKKAPMNGYQKFSQELLSNGELNHLPLKERMVEIGSRWQRISLNQKDYYKKLAEDQQRIYRVQLETWMKGLSSQDRAAYKEQNSNKRKSTTKLKAPSPKSKPVVLCKSEEEDEEEDEDDDEDEEEDKEESSDDGDSSSSSEDDSDDAEENEDGEEDDDDEEEDEDNESGSSSSSSSSADSSDSDSN